MKGIGYFVSPGQTRGDDLFVVSLLKFSKCRSSAKQSWRGPHIRWVVLSCWVFSVDLILHTNLLGLARLGLHQTSHRKRVARK